MAKRQPSRPKRWADAVASAREAFDAVKEKADDLATALGELHEVQGEYQEWRDNLPEGLDSTALAEKLDAVIELDIEGVTDDPLDSWGTVEEVIDNAEGIDLPLGFGRD